MNRTRTLALTATTLVAAASLAFAVPQDAPKAPASTPPAATPTAPAAPAAPAANLPAASEILDKYTASLGGKETIAAIKSSRYKGTIDTMMGQATIEIATMLPNLMKFNQSMQGMSIEQGCDGTNGWMTNPATGQPELLEPAMVEGMREGNDVQAMLRSPASLYGDFKTTGEEKVDTVDCWVVSMKSKAGESANMLFDKSTGLLKAFRQSQQGPQGAANVTIMISDWMDAAVDKANLKVFKTMVVEQQGMKVTGTFSDFEFNKLDAAFFAAPAKIKEMAAERAKGAAAPGGTPAEPAKPAAAPTDAPKEAPKDAPAKPQG